jgi:hypothetical protein
VEIPAPLFSAPGQEELQVPALLSGKIQFDFSEKSFCLPYTQLKIWGML